MVRVRGTVLRCLCVCVCTCSAGGVVLTQHCPAPGASPHACLPASCPATINFTVLNTPTHIYMQALLIVKYRFERPLDVDFFLKPHISIHSSLFIWLLCEWVKHLFYCLMTTKVSQFHFNSKSCWCSRANLLHNEPSCEKVLMNFIFRLNDSDHQTNFNITQR